MKSKRFVFDTNIIVSAFLFDSGKPRRALNYALQNGTILVSTETAKELFEVLERDKFDKYVKREIRQDLVLSLLEEAEYVYIEEQVQESRDPADDKFLELAVSGQAEYVISGDKDLLVLRSFRSIPIITVDEFLKIEEVI